MSYDIVVIIILALVSSVIIGFNIISVVDKKLSNVSISLPPIVIRNCSSAETDKLTYGYDSKPNIPEHFDPIVANDSIRYPFENNIINYDDYVCKKKTTLSEHNNNPVNSQVNMNHKTIVGKVPTNAFTLENTASDINISGNYGGKYGNDYKGQVANKVSQATQYGCNKTIASQYASGNVAITEQTMCHNNENIDPANYYKKRHSYPVNEFDNERHRGYNYSEFSNYAGIHDIGNIMLDKTRNFPVASNYGFTAQS